MRARWFAAAAGIAALIACAASLALVAETLPSPAKAAPVDPRPAYCDDPTGTDDLERAGSVAAIFIQSTVFSDGDRVAAECSYDLVTTAFRQGDTRAEWKQGNIPVVPFVVDFLGPGYVSSAARSVTPVYRTKLGLPCDPVAQADVCELKEVSAEIVCQGVAEHRPVQTVFLIRLVKRQGDWKISYWQPLPSLGGLGGPSSAR
jgi:hypothetical protein